MKSKISITIEESILKNLDGFIDGINIRNRSQAIEGILSKRMNENKIAVILASKIDEFRILSRVKGEPLIVKTVKNLQSYSFKKVFMIGEKKILSKIFEILGTGQDYLLEIEYIEDSEPKGSAKSLSLLKNKIKSNFLTIPADNYFEMDLNSLWNFHAKTDNLMNLAITVSPNPTKLGVVNMQGEKVIGFVQKSKQSNNYLVWSGIMICKPEILFYDFKSIDEETIPKLIELSKVGGFIFTGTWANIHTKKDIIELNNKNIYK